MVLLLLTFYNVILLCVCFAHLQYFYESSLGPLNWGETVDLPLLRPLQFIIVFLLIWSFWTYYFSCASIYFAFLRRYWSWSVVEKTDSLTHLLLYVNNWVRHLRGKTATKISEWSCKVGNGIVRKKGGIVCIIIHICK